MISAQPPLIFLNPNNDVQTGAYLLRMYVQHDLQLPFGGFKRGKQVRVPAGEYLYLGSAMGKRGSASLAHRLLRHATRSGGRPPHPIRDAMLARFRQERLGPGDIHPPAVKKLHWNVDYLLDRPGVDLAGGVIIRSAVRLENALGAWLSGQPETRVVEKGLGASDLPGRTHILRVDAGQTWWQTIPARMEAFLATSPAL